MGERRHYSDREISAASYAMVKAFREQMAINPLSACKRRLMESPVSHFVGWQMEEQNRGTPIEDVYIATVSLAAWVVANSAQSFLAGPTPARLAQVVTHVYGEAGGLLQTGIPVDVGRGLDWPAEAAGKAIAQAAASGASEAYRHPIAAIHRAREVLGGLGWHALARDLGSAIAALGVQPDPAAAALVAAGAEARERFTDDELEAAAAENARRSAEVYRVPADTRDAPDAAAALEEAAGAHDKLDEIADGWGVDPGGGARWQGTAKKGAPDDDKA